ncbi:MAG: 50S ribosomal protein L25 [Deltaproteobacteria bacterium]|jgi:large subunit ribosomal protein L25|nr:50S ribosomal protein L25 [Deltaproteobacteria bacterium]
MGLNTTLAAKPRLAGSSNQAGRLRAQGLLPVVCYGGDLESAVPLSLDYAEFKTAFLSTEGNRFLYTLAVEGQEPGWVQLKEFQTDPVSRKLIHADFIKISKDKPVSVKVPVVLTGRAQGVEKGGQIQQGEREAVITGLPGDIPDHIEADVTSLGLGQTLHLSQVPLPSGLKLAKKVDLPVAVIVIPKGMKAEVEAQAAGAAPGAEKKAPEKKAEKKK